MNTKSPTFQHRAASILLVFAAALFLHGTPKAHGANATAAIINGTAVSQAVYDAQYPFQVALFAENSTDSFLCGGTLIAPRWVLTAAHCKEASMGIEPQYAMIGRVNQSDTSRGEVIPVEFNSQYPRWNSQNRTTRYDLMLVRLTAAPTNPIPVPLATAAEDPEGGKTVTAIGWGLTSSRSTSPPTTLRRASLTIKGRTSCSRAWHGDIFKSMICASKASKPQRGVCSGDSGGPILYKGRQVGITSFGTGRCRSYPPNVFTRVSAYREEILATIAANP